MHGSLQEVSERPLPGASAHSSIRSRSDQDVATQPGVSSSDLEGRSSDQAPAPEHSRTFLPGAGGPEACKRLPPTAISPDGQLASSGHGGLAGSVSLARSWVERLKAGAPRRSMRRLHPRPTPHRGTLLGDRSAPNPLFATTRFRPCAPLAQRGVLSQAFTLCPAISGSSILVICSLSLPARTDASRCLPASPSARYSPRSWQGAAGVRVSVGWVLMPDHFHLLIEPWRADLKGKASPPTPRFDRRSVTGSCEGRRCRT